ncbi:hypothetical protein ACFSQ7_20470 [Paenibacillus rhizoplanae]
MKGLLAGAVALEIISKTEGTYTVLNAMADSLFHYLPLLLAFTAARKFGANPFTAVVIGGVMLYPSLTTLFANNETIEFMGMSIKPVNYPASAIPIILAVGLLVYVERFCVKNIAGGHPRLLHSTDLRDRGIVGDAAGVRTDGSAGRGCSCGRVSCGV